MGVDHNGVAEEETSETRDDTLQVEDTSSLNETMPSDSLYNTSSCDLQDLQITDSMPNTDQTEINSSSSNPLESQNFSHSAALSSNESSGCQWIFKNQIQS
ncbi:uncharacterized protein LOC129315768 isoform X4 [Prosopis cineraria]|uniref:uncharacterized protein LOC129315768 isoform X4 n=1 Tax=Prosopis cineraria TaxID=364024 RepID=UPI00240F9C5C|nr:uncharacterized protein LOC129315768 isoform X4 [Prosopis cineraria]